MKTFSKAWNLEDRLRLTLLLTHMIRDDIHKNQYGLPGRPNIQSIHELMISTAAEIEPYRGDIEKWVDTFGRDNLFCRIPAWEENDN